VADVVLGLVSSKGEVAAAGVTEAGLGQGTGQQRPRTMRSRRYGSASYRTMNRRVIPPIESLAPRDHVIELG
jgi:hypothetical protein